MAVIVEFYDQASGRTMKLDQFFDHGYWLFYKGAEGQWVTLREATPEDLSRLDMLGRNK